MVGQGDTTQSGRRWTITVGKAPEPQCSSFLFPGLLVLFFQHGGFTLQLIYAMEPI